MSIIKLITAFFMAFFQIISPIGVMLTGGEAGKSKVIISTLVQISHLIYEKPEYTGVRCTALDCTV